MERLSYQGHLLLALLFVVGHGQAAAQGKYAGEPNWKDVCARATAKPLEAPVTAHGECDSRRLYYGFDGAPDRTAALSCAYYERAHPRTDTGGSFYGPGILSMLYANGFGVARDYTLAIRFACEDTWAADAEMEGRIGHLEYLRRTHPKATDFDLCDDATSGLMEGACADIDEQYAKAKREEKLKEIVAGWTPEAKQAFPDLQKAEKAFAEAHARKEIDLTGSGRAAFSIEAESKVHELFVATLQAITNGLAPNGDSDADYKNSDDALNASYRKLIDERSKERKDDRSPGSVEVAGIRETERVWIKYRDAWMAFGKVAFPATGAERIGAIITRQRIEQLKDVE